MNCAVKFLLLASLCVSSSVFALNTPPACPSVTSIIDIINTEGFDYVVRLGEDNSIAPWALAKLKSKFDTQDEWTFHIIVGASNKTASEAIASAKIMLSTLSNLNGPLNTGYENICDYQSTLVMVAQASAVNPPQMLPLKITLR